ncbi:MAG: sugar phosphate isomerase/epimerase [Clostridia bacterium]|nr:sugar phosphate isomerase/epimerase [Clostridia bacterium]
MERKISLCIGALSGTWADKYGFLDSLDIIKELGFDGIDFDLNDYNLFTNPDSIYLKSEQEFSAYFENIKNEVEKRGLVIFQTHGTMRTFRENDEEYNTVTFPKNAECDLKASKILGAPVCVFHPGSDLSNPNATPEEMRFRARRAFSSILPFGKENNVKVALETVGSNWTLNNKLDFFGAYDEFRALFDDVRDMNPECAEWWVCCIDTGHINMTGQHNQPTPAEFIRRMGDNVYCLHLHDNDGYFDGHRILCGGTIDWVDVFNALKEISYNNNFNSEVTLKYISEDLIVPTAEFTIKTIRDFITRFID